ncbi:HalOD1 output domain-containing protein [Natronococcus wangiae]|uniref:HalOD1 output domain-containing protein n=1 Tax=Natronococcus wangiae TaxID=3068275 RepID=UPI00273FB769|nr:HalOD1 output domain-containing protein [Natronococcus sp. AD5]
MKPYNSGERVKITTDQNDERQTDGGCIEIQTKRKESEPVSGTIIRGLAAVENVSISEVNPLYEQIDTDALDRLFSHAKHFHTDVAVEFSIDEYTVTVTCDDTV